MTGRNLFMFENGNGYEQHQLVTGVDDKQANQLTESGKAVEVSLGEYGDFRKQAQALHSEYKKKKEKIKAEDNPLYTKEVKDFEQKKAYTEFEQASKQLQADWESKRQAMQAEAQTRAVRAKVSLTESDRQTAKQLTDRLSLSVKASSNANDFTNEVGQITESIKLLSDEEKTAMSGEIDRLLDAIEIKSEKLGAKADTRSIINAVKDVRNMDILGAKVAEQLQPSVTQEYDRAKLLKNR